MTTEDDRRNPDAPDDIASADDSEGYTWDDPSTNQRAVDPMPVLPCFILLVAPSMGTKLLKELADALRDSDGSAQNLSHILALMPEPIARAFGDQFLEHSARWNKSLWHSGLAPDVVREMTPEDANDLHLFLSIMVRKVSERNQWESRLSAERMRELELAERQTTGS